MSGNLLAAEREAVCGWHNCRLPAVLSVSFRPHAVGPAGWAVSVCAEHAVPVPETLADQRWGVGVDALRLQGRSETEWDVIDGRSDRVVGRVIRQNDSNVLTDVDGDIERDAAHGYEQTVTAQHTLSARRISLSVD